MEFKDLLKELDKLNNDQIAKIVATIVRRCLPTTKNWQNYFHKYFPFWEKLGFHITLNDFYSPLPEIYKLKSELWEKIPETPCIDYKAKSQLELLKQFHNKYKKEYEKIPIKKTANPLQYYLIGGKYEGIDGYILYCMIRHLKPKRIIEIGSGLSTLLSAQACIKNKKDTGLQTTFIAIEPYPNKTLQKGFPGLTKLIPKKAEEVDPELFNQLEKDDILFIDSSHVLKIDNDVKFEYANILPKLKKGTIIHIHDIFLPAEYPKEFIYGFLFLFNEQYLVQSILANSKSFEIMWASHFMFLKHLKELTKAFLNYKRVKKSPLHASSLWIRKKE
jgi:predicted O-methyltransferase YrrM